MDEKIIQWMDARGIVVKKYQKGGNIHQKEDLYLLLKDKYKWTPPRVIFDGQEDEVEETLDTAFKNMGLELGAALKDRRMSDIKKEEELEDYLFRKEDIYENKDHEKVNLTILAYAMEVDTMPDQVRLISNYRDSKWSTYEEVLRSLTNDWIGIQRDVFRNVCESTGLFKIK